MKEMFDADAARKMTQAARNTSDFKFEVGRLLSRTIDDIMEATSVGADSLAMRPAATDLCGALNIAAEKLRERGFHVHFRPNGIMDVDWETPARRRKPPVALE